LSPTDTGNSSDSPLRRGESQDSMTKLKSDSASEHIQALYRLLLIRTGQRIRAEHALRETLSASPQDTDPAQNGGDLTELYRTALKMPSTADKPLETDLAGWPLALHRLPEPERSAITLFYLEIFNPPALSEILGLTLEELARLIDAARKSLESQQTKSTAA
jgi:hypothetical protein